ncbi:hypothetical protein BCV69DRAFT_100460 [Microstroma glucosiphilum]|uniref:Uncharacterized protein n=1 Tax=Pseudomicrostroma glucosiphilum TaxID=1684307 RepID=A0A316UI82_9BASI|nr:hypothetical protein BCV69DRAFT_100460 [Pseudomicrostroma glucosiphilum]PWN22895.1 hypothetical protein BCV69DRAFT_100460 [Pseudomicrostroma glucosiphilum]
MRVTQTLPLFLAGAATVLAQEAVTAESFNAAQDRYFNKTWDPTKDLPDKSQNNQIGTNKCGTDSSDTSMCQNLFINSATDFCLYSNPSPGIISDHEAEGVSYCTKSGRGTRTIPAGTITSATFVKTPSYVQVTGLGDFTRINVQAGDDGGEYDFGAASGEGNPKGNLVFSCSDKKCTQRHRWMLFLSDKQYCLRACEDGPNSEAMCRHTYDRLGCEWNMPGDYIEGHFQNCESDDAPDVMFHDGKQYVQGDGPLDDSTVPPAHPAPALRNCVPVKEADLYGHLTGDVFGGTKGLKVAPGAGDAAKGGALPSNATTKGDLPAKNGTTIGTPVLDAGSMNSTANGTVADSPSTAGNQTISANSVIGIEASYRIGLGLLASFSALLAGCVLL